MNWIDPWGERCWNPFDPEFWADLFGGNKAPAPPDPNSNRALLNEEGHAAGTFTDENGNEISGAKCTALVCGAVAAGVLTAITDGLGGGLGKGEQLGAKAFKARKAGQAAKEAAKDIPSWAKGVRPFIKEKGRDFAKRLLDIKYGPGKYDTGPGSEFSKLKKFCDRAFE